MDLLLAPIILNKCFLSDEKEDENTGTNTTCLKFAVSNELIKFLNHPAAKKSFNLFWYDKILQRQKQTLNTWPKVKNKFFNLRIFTLSVF